MTNEPHTKPSSPSVAVIGGGAAGYFASIHCAQRGGSPVELLEGTLRPLTKVRISGGGRCNVTHSCFDPTELVKFYPRGSRELRGPFSRFQPRDTIAWFEKRGVPLKVEEDGRMFPTTDDSATIATCLQNAAATAGVKARLGVMVKSIQRDSTGFVIEVRETGGVSHLVYDRVILTTGGAPQGHEFARSLGHTIVPAVPSLFTFNVNDPRLADLAGVSVEETHLTLHPEGTDAQFTQKGPLLITHWGLSGPAVLKLSAWGARELAGSRYKGKLVVNLLPPFNATSFQKRLMERKPSMGNKLLVNEFVPQISKRFIARLCAQLGFPPDLTWSHVNSAMLGRLANEICQGSYRVDGKGVFKEEFVTAGGVSLKEVDFRSMESKICPGLYFAGEILDIDGITGGFNFQNAWTTAYIAGESAGS